MGIPDAFLLDEVRCGFLVPAAVKQAWAAELEVLMEIDRVCRKHQIQYFADWGTLLGAVRHGGFVPWDDDLDIVMKREDYMKFMTVARFDLEEGFDVQTYRNQKDFWLFMGKVVGKNRFCFEKEHLRRFHNFPYIACVDIFVLDYVYRDPEKEEKRRVLCKYMLGMADAIVEGRFSPGEQERSLQIAEELYGQRLKRIQDPVEMGRYLYGEVEKIFAQVPEEEADCLSQLFPCGLVNDNYYFPKEYYKQSISVPFEFTTIPVPFVYDKMLKLRYGDYMKPVKNAGGHDYPFFEGQKQNLQKVLDFDLPAFRLEPGKLYRSDEEQACRKQSYKELTKECTRELWRMQEEILAAAENNRKHADQEQVMELIQMSQQLAVDFGTLLEQILGEDSTIIHLLEQYCEELYVLYEQILQDSTATDTHICSRLCQIKNAITVELEENILGRKAVLFLPVFAKDWEGLHSLWKAAGNDPAYDVYVVPLPYYYKDYDGSPRKLCCDVEEFPEEIRALDYKMLTPEYLELLRPEMIIIQNPYDAWNPAVSVPEKYYSERIRKYTDKLIYIPPFAVEEYSKESARAYLNMKYYVTMPGVMYADQVIVQSENMKRVYVEKLVEFAGEETRAIWEQRVLATGIPIMDKTYPPKSNQRKKILYGISLGTCMENAEEALKKISRNFQIFEEYKEQIDLTIEFYPNVSDILEIKKQIVKLIEAHGFQMMNHDEKDSVMDYDAYYGDAMPAATEFQQIGKPVMIQDISV